MKKIFKKIVPIIIITLIGIFICFILFNKENISIIGAWDIDGNTKYEFDKKGEGKLIVPNNEYKFSYEINDNILSIDFENELSKDVEYEYELDKDTLKITNTKETNLKYTLKRVKE